MSFRNLEYLIQEAFIGIWRNGIMAIASISTVTLSLAILGVFLLMASSSQRFINQQLASFEIMVFMPDNGTQQAAENVRDTIAKLDLTKHAELLSRDKEWAEFKPKLNTEIDLGGVTNNPLPYSIDVESKDTRKTSVLAEQIRKIPGVQEVKIAVEEYRFVKGLADLVRLLGYIGAGILFFATVFIIMNAIRLTLFARRHEIRIMQLVGATNWFIRVPLVLEGIVLGVLGAVIATGLVAVGGRCVANLATNVLPQTLRSTSSGIGPAQFIFLLTLLGGAIGALGSMLSIKRFLKV